MDIQLTLQHIGMQLDEAKSAFYMERKEPQSDSEMLGQLVEDFRDELDKLDSQVRSLRYELQRMEDTLKEAEGVVTAPESGPDSREVSCQPSIA